MQQPEEAVCSWCGNTHGKLCPYVKAFEFDVAGNVTRVEFHPANLKQEGSPPQEDYERLGRKDAAK